MDMPAMVDYLRSSGYLSTLVNNPMAQFGPGPQRFIGPELLPERETELLDYTEQAIQFRTVIANDSTRYAPVQKKESTILGSLRVQLGHNDIGDDLKARDYDAIVNILRQIGEIGDGDAPSMMAVNLMLGWVDKALVRPLNVKNEKDRWAAMVNASLVRTGDGNYTETVSYPNPAGHRSAAGGTWSNPSYDPYTDIMAKVELLRGKGYTVNRIITDTPTVSIMALNAKMTARVGRLAVVAGSVVNNPAGRVTLQELAAAFGREGLPPVETYDLQYRTQTSSGYYFPRGTMFFACTTGRDETIDRGDLEPLIMQNTLGYEAIGPAAGQPGPGKVTKIFPKEDKPVRVEGESYQASIPVITDPEAIAVITGIA
jgi:hypothetical protein